MPFLTFRSLCVPGLAVALGLSWLLPNHYPPWMSFHSEAFASFVLVVAAVGVFFRVKGKTAWIWPSLFLFAICLIPWVQLLTGEIFFFGTAWIHSVFLFGLFISFVTGYQWEGIRKNQCADFIFMAIGLASIISVSIQLYQWLGYESNLWISNSMRERPFANLGQPNQLGSLLLLGLLAVVWGQIRGWFNNYLVVVLAVFILFGVALTQSRTALLSANLACFVLAVWAHTRSLNKFKWLLVGFCIYLFALFFGLPHLYTSSAETFATRMSNEPRLVIWHTFYDAILSAPLGGYGWGQIARAQIEIASPSHNLGGLYTQSHNLILDLLLWNGLLCGALIILAVGVFCKKILHAINDLSSLLLILFIGVLAIHSMLEFPLHYAYFLFPAGMISGILASSSNFRPVFFSTKLPLLFLLLTSLAVFVITVSDYQKIAQSYYDLRSELAGIKNDKKGTAPDVIALNQMRELILFARFNPSENMQNSEIEWMQYVAKTYPSPNNFRKVAIAFAFNDRAEDAKSWLGYICNIFGPTNASVIHNVWVAHAELNPLIAQVAWPEGCYTDN